ncbi:MAG: pyruvate ferredoxin oxidoreductase [Acidobacteriota bacterium]
MTVKGDLHIEVTTGNHAVSHGVRLARAEVISAYPITPQTQVVELLSQFCEEGLLKARFIKVESEHSAMAALVGAASTGARTFTATSAQGLALMHEMLHWAAGARLPIVMANVNRAMGAPWSVWTDQNDSLSQRDTGWLQIYCESNQEVLDTVLQSFKLAETVRLPVMLILDAFVLSHTAEPVEIPDPEDADRFLPPYRPGLRLDPSDPHAFNGLTTPDSYMEFRVAMQESMIQALEVAKSVDQEFAAIFGRSYGIIEAYRCDDAELMVITSSTVTSTAREVIDRLRDEGRRVGLLKIRLFRPFPAEELRRLCAGAAKLAVIDRNIGFGVGGIFAQEVRAALYNHLVVPVYGFIAGLGGRDITPETILEIVQWAETNEPADSIWIGVKR